MRIFQTASIRPEYKRRLRQLTPTEATFPQRMAIYHKDAYIAVHTLLPVLDGAPEAFYTIADDEIIQRRWANERGMPDRSSLESILLAQIEEHRAEVFYTLSTTAVSSDLARRMPACVKAKIGHHAAPHSGHDMSAYLMVNNFPTILEYYRSLGIQTAYFAPSYDPAFDRLMSKNRRDIDILFVGTYSRWHKRRAKTLEEIAALSSKYNVVFSLTRSKLNRLAETPLGLFGPLNSHRRPSAIRAITQAPTFGMAYNELLCRAKIIFNGATDIGGDDRGNMRCWEALGARALMVSDAGAYPEGMRDGVTMRTYQTPEEAVSVIESALSRPQETSDIAAAGHEMVRTLYSKERQWNAFQKIVESRF